MRRSYEAEAVMKTENKMDRKIEGRGRWTPIALLAITVLMSFSCTNTRSKSAVNLSSTSQVKEEPAATPTDGSVFKISSVRVDPPARASTGQIVDQATIFLDNRQVPKGSAITDFCQGSTDSAPSAKPCTCQFAWDETNLSSIPVVIVPHVVQTTVSLVQPTLIACNVPDIYAEEIPDGTTVRLSIKAAPGNTTGFNGPTASYKKGPAAERGDFQDALGHSFVNIVRYACYDKRKRGISIKNKIIERTSGDLDPIPRRVPLANTFCAQKASGQITGGCQSQQFESPNFTAQSYYYNLYIRDSESGGINPGNSNFVCPLVRESLGDRGSVGSQGKYWPLDSSFALSLGRTPDFNVGVVANTHTSNGADPTSKPSSCDGPEAAASAGTTGSGTLVHSCLGFASKPKSDGTCPVLLDEKGKAKPTFRLRRFIALYPPVFDTNGETLKEPQATDTIYVIDRPVKSPNPNKTYTMLGPKPCPFAYFDTKGVALGSPLYVSTSNPAWAGKNIDGIEFPRADSLNSCSAVLPILSPDQKKFTLTTINAGNHNPKFRRMFIRPIEKEWAPHYEEDTDFQACAPLSEPFLDPPLHFAKDTSGNIAYCAEAYPTQNDNLGVLDPGLVGNVPPFTSHLSKNTLSNACRSTSITIPRNEVGVDVYPVAGPARHPHLVADTDFVGVSLFLDQTCDRTVINETSGGQNPGTSLKFPLLATAGGIEAAIIRDKTYSCSITFDEGGTKSRNGKTPKQGCCGENSFVWSNPDEFLIHRSPAGHMEPDKPCLPPEY